MPPSGTFGWLSPSNVACTSFTAGALSLLGDEGAAEAEFGEESWTTPGAELGSL
jgi:hypothetical protein